MFALDNKNNIINDVKARLKSEGLIIPEEIIGYYIKYSDDLGEENLVESITQRIIRKIKE
jgi:hypothetical protein